MIRNNDPKNQNVITFNKYDDLIRAHYTNLHSYR